MYRFIDFLYCCLIADDDGEITVSVMLDGEETTLNFIDMPNQQIQVRI